MLYFDNSDGIRQVIAEDDGNYIDSYEVSDDDYDEAIYECIVDSVADKNTTRKEKDFAVKVAKKILEYDTGEIKDIFREDLEQEILHYLDNNR